eukprot:gene15154-biopygen5824
MAALAHVAGKGVADLADSGGLSGRLGGLPPGWLGGLGGLGGLLADSATLFRILRSAFRYVSLVGKEHPLKLAKLQKVQSGALCSTSSVWRFCVWPLST